jgi:hypothetical protein
MSIALLSLQERNRRALELLLQKDATIRTLQQQLQQRSSDSGPVPAAADAPAVAAALSRAEAAEAALQQAQQQHAHELVSIMHTLNSTRRVSNLPCVFVCLLCSLMHSCPGIYQFGLQVSLD